MIVGGTMQQSTCVRISLKNAEFHFVHTEL